MINIVIIEDQPIILEGIKVLINQVEDFNVIRNFENGKEFIDKLHELQFDILLTDIDMPVMNGIETAKKALTINPEMKIIALSMYSDYTYYYEMITAGAAGFVLKQASTDELEQAIRVVNDGGSFFSRDLMHGVILNMQRAKIESQEKEKVNELTERELELLTLICGGLSNKELADKMFLSVKTIESNKKKLMLKTGTKNTATLIIWAIKNKVVQL